MMIVTCDADSTCITVFTPCGFRKLTRPTLVMRRKQHIIIRKNVNMCQIILRRHNPRIRFRKNIKRNKRQGNNRQHNIPPRQQRCPGAGEANQCIDETFGPGILFHVDVKNTPCPPPMRNRYAIYPSTRTPADRQTMITGVFSEKMYPQNLPQRPLVTKRSTRASTLGTSLVKTRFAIPIGVFLPVSFKLGTGGPEAWGGAKEDGEDEEGEGEDEGYGVGEEGCHNCFNMGTPWRGEVGDDGNGSWFFWSLWWWRVGTPIWGRQIHDTTTALTCVSFVQR
jgi:hypothetical protein